jgi:chemotaxis signal transduction protein
MRQAKAVETVWSERALRLSERQVSAGPAENTFPVLVLGIAAERYGIDLPDVAEVFPRMRPTPVPGTDAIFAGVINVHGEIRPVIDLARYLGMEPAVEKPKDGMARVILLRKERRELGLQIDSVEHIRWISGGELQTTGMREAGSRPQVKACTNDLLLLSTEALFAQLQPAQPETGVTT